MEGTISHYYSSSLFSSTLNLSHSKKSNFQLNSNSALMVDICSLRASISSLERDKLQPLELQSSPKGQIQKTHVKKKETQNLVKNKPMLNSEISPHRAVSAVRLMRIEFGGAFADLLNEKGKGSGANEMGYVERTLGFRTRKLEDRDLRLVTDIVGGAIRWRRYLDHLIVSLCDDERTFRNMEPLLLQILRIGFYEIAKLEMPPYAVVDENVRLAKTALRPGAGNLVNGILRKLVLLKENDTLPLPKLEGDDRSQARALATLHSHPVWMVRRWVKHLGQDEAVKLMMWNNSAPSFSIRANSAKGFTRADLVKRLEELEIVLQAGLLKEGLCSVQDESAGMVVSIMEPQPGENVVDCCAAPGGKSLFHGMVSAIDINEGRLRILKETAMLLEFADVITTVHSDLRIFAEKNTVMFDKVLLDAPCSGLGVLSKRADLRWNRRSEDMEQHKNLQDELLDSASTLTKLGGILVYSTCSIDPEENEERVASFLQRHPE
ncbi:hypothetical protein MKW92_015738 [Papaver armeniacum]|nr:hypothetical protein MKW92_015738 [Papaver armeniacum]